MAVVAMAHGQGPAPSPGPAVRLRGPPRRDPRRIPASSTRDSSAVGEWRHYGGDAGARKVLAAGADRRETLPRLQVAWQWPSPDNAVVAANPDVAPRRLSGHAVHGQRRALHGDLPGATGGNLRPGTGAAIWTFDPGSWRAGRPGNLGFVHRGLAYWTDGTRERLLVGTGDAYLIAVDARTGVARSGLRRRRPRRPDGQRGARRAHDALLELDRRRSCAATSSSSARACTMVPATKEYPRGDVTGYDVRTGKRLWTFHSIPAQGRASGTTPGAATPPEYTGSTNVWTLMSADEELGLRLPAVWHADQRLLRRPSPGRQPFADRSWPWTRRTGKRRVALPGGASRAVGLRLAGRADARRHHRRRHGASRRVAQVSKQGFIYVLDRRDRAAGVADRGAARAAVGGAGRAHVADAAVPDQAAGVRAPGSHRRRPHRLHARAAARALEVVQEYDRGPLFTPPSERGTVQLPGWVGGANWGGAAFDPETRLLYVPSLTSPRWCSS